MSGLAKWALAAVLALLLAAPAPIAAFAGETFETDRLAVTTAAGGHYPFAVEVARTARQRAQGLQGRKALARGAGMLFDFGRTEPVTMWMKDTFVSLDMLFIAADGLIRNIARDTAPGSLAVIESKGPVRAVLEVRAGTAASLGIRPGDRVEHPIFKPSGARP